MGRQINGGFEKGDDTGWILNIGELTNDNPHFGVYCAHSVGGWLDFLQDYTTSPYTSTVPIDTLFSASVWIRSTEADSLTVWFYTDDLTGYYSYNFIDTTTSWKKYDLLAIMASLDIVGSGISLTEIEFTNAYATTDTAIDDYNLVSFGEQIFNGGLETGDDSGWEIWVGSVTNDNPHSGTYCAQVINDVMDISVDFINTQPSGEPIDVDTLTSASVWIRSTEATDTLELVFLVLGEGDPYIYPITDATVGWKQYDLLAIMTSLSMIGSGKLMWLIGFSGLDVTTDTAIDDLSFMISSGGSTTITYDIDVLLNKKGLTTTNSTDIILKKLGITTTDSIDVLLKKLGVTRTDLIDMILSPYPTRSSEIDAIFQKLGIITTDKIDVKLTKKVTSTDLIDVELAQRVTSTDSIDVFLMKTGIKLTDSIDVLLKKLGLKRTVSIDILLKKLAIISTAKIDAQLISLILPTPPAQVPETLKITNGTNTLWARPISWKESQNCDPAIRPLPLAQSEYLDKDTWVLKPRTIECIIRLSDREKDTFENLYNDAPVNGSNKYLDFYLLYNDLVSGVYIVSYTWHYVVWIREKSYKWDYVLQDNRYVRWWTVTLLCDVQNFTGSSSTLPTWNSSTGYTTYLEDSNWTNLYNIPFYDPIAKAVRISDERLNQILDFSRDDQHPPMIPNWINQLVEVDSYIWNECVLDTAYTCRMTNAEKYHMDLLLQAHQKVLYEDYIHNVFSPKAIGQTVPNYGAWIASVDAQWDATNWEKPWKVSIALKVNNSETESRTALVVVNSTNHLGNMFLDEITVGPDPNATSSTLPWSYDGDYGDSNSCNVGVHTFYYFFTPTSGIYFDHWAVTGDAFILDEKGHTANGIGGEHILTVLIYGDCFINVDLYVPPIPTPTEYSIDIQLKKLRVTTGSSIDAILDLQILTEHIVNGGFETGDFTGWTYSPPYWNGYVWHELAEVNGTHHSGSYGAELVGYTEEYQVPYGTQEYFAQTLGTPAPVDNVSVFGFWYLCPSESMVARLVVVYSDSSTTDIYIPSSGSWTYLNCIPYLTAGKTIVSILFDQWTPTENCYIDDVSLQTVS